MTRRIIFAGTPDFAVPVLQTLIARAAEKNIEICAVYTQPDRPSGRGRKLQASPVKQVAQSHHLPIVQLENFKNPADIAALKAHNADLMLVVAFGLLLPMDVLSAPKFGCVNLHASLLPKWRGAAPIARAILAGDAQTGVTLMQMNQGLDTGAMIASCQRDIGSCCAQELHDQLAQDAAGLFIQHLDALLAGACGAVDQDDPLACYAAKLQKAEGVLDCQKSAVVLCRQIRAFNPYPIAFAYLPDSKMLRIHRAQVHSPHNSSQPAGSIIQCDKNGILLQTGDGVLALLELQLAGKSKQSAAQFANGQALLGQQLHMSPS